MPQNGVVDTPAQPQDQQVVEAEGEWTVLSTLLIETGMCIMLVVCLDD